MLAASLADTLHNHKPIDCLTLTNKNYEANKNNDILFSNLNDFYFSVGQSKKKLRNIKTTRIILIIVLTGALNIELKSQSVTKNLDDSRIELEAINSRIEQLYLTEDVNTLTTLYASQFTFFPEYKPAIFEIKALNKFLKTGLRQEMLRYTRKKYLQWRYILIICSN
jgi:hypothetical protein